MYHIYIVFIIYKLKEYSRYTRYEVYNSSIVFAKKGPCTRISKINEVSWHLDENTCSHTFIKSYKQNPSLFLLSCILRCFMVFVSLCVITLQCSKTSIKTLISFAHLKTWPHHYLASVPYVNILWILIKDHN